MKMRMKMNKKTNYFLDLFFVLSFFRFIVVNLFPISFCVSIMNALIIRGKNIQIFL
jgi:hypothetical protein